MLTHQNHTRQKYFIKNFILFSLLFPSYLLMITCRQITDSRSVNVSNDQFLVCVLRASVFMVAKSGIIVITHLSLMRACVLDGCQTVVGAATA